MIDKKVTIKGFRIVQTYMYISLLVQQDIAYANMKGHNLLTTSL